MKEEVYTAFIKSAFQKKSQNNGNQQVKEAPVRYQICSFSYLCWKILFILDGLKVQSRTGTF